MNKSLLLTVLVAAALVLTGCYKKTFEPVDEMGFAKQVISALANDNEAFFQKHLVTIDDFDELIKCELLQEEIQNELDSGETMEDIKQEFVEKYQEQEKIKKRLHGDYQAIRSNLRSRGIDLKDLKIIKSYADDGWLMVELEGDSTIYEFGLEAVKLSTRWVISGDFNPFSVKSISR